jgi:uncharacterized protein (DUF1778 family)
MPFEKRQSRDKTIAFSVTQEEMDLIKTWAGNQAQSVSDFVRDAIDGYIQQLSGPKQPVPARRS